MQARQVYVFETAGRLGWTGPWREAVAHGANFLRDRAVGPHGLAPATYDLDGRSKPGTADLYDQAFVLLAHAHAERVLGDGRHRAAALALIGALGDRLGRGDGGFDETRPPTAPLRSNPHMHLLEAALAWIALDGRILPWARMADGAVDLAVRRFIDPATGRLREFFDLDWSPAAGSAGRLTEPGHQFEWCWLLLWNARLGGADHTDVARRLAELASAGGVVGGVAVNGQAVTGELTDPSARLWPQTEWLKAALALASRARSPEEKVRWIAEAGRATDALRRFLDRPVPGLWADLMAADGSFRAEAAPASSLYHITCALAELLDPVA